MRKVCEGADTRHDLCEGLRENVESTAGIMLVCVVILINLVATLHANPSNDLDAPEWLNLSASIFTIDTKMLVR